MKRIFIYTVFFSLAVVLGCKKQLDIKPEGVFTESQVVTSQSTSEALLADAYFKTYQASVLPNTSNGMGYMIGDVSTSTSILSAGYSNYLPLINGTVTSSDPTVANLWNLHYSAINEANVLINLLPQQNWNTAIQNTFIAEAKFIRAYNYFCLLELFGDGALNGQMDKACVPLRLTNFSGYDNSQNIPRNKNSEVYAQILKDLDEAAAVLTNTESDNLKLRTRAQAATCNALASRVALYMGDNDKTITYSDNALSAPSKFTLLSSPALVFPDNGAGAFSNLPLTNEWFFCFPVSYNKNLNTGNALHNIAYFSKTGIWPNPDFISSYDSNDIRKSMFVMGNTPTAVTTGRLCPVKFSEGSGSVTPPRAPNFSNTLRDNIVVLRVAEMYLNKAEALARKSGVSQGSIDMLNQIHTRAGLTAFNVSDFPSSDSLLHTIWRERRWEFAYESMDRYDQIRIGNLTNLPPDLGIKYVNPALSNSQKWVLPIPSNDIVLTFGLLTQNPGY